MSAKSSALYSVKHAKSTMRCTSFGGSNVSYVWASAAASPSPKPTITSLEVKPRLRQTRLLTCICRQGRQLFRKFSVLTNFNCT